MPTWVPAGTLLELAELFVPGGGLGNSSKVASSDVAPHTHDGSFSQSVGGLTANPGGPASEDLGETAGRNPDGGSPYNISTQGTEESAGQAAMSGPSVYGAPRVPPTQQGDLRYRGQQEVTYDYAGFWIRLVAWALDFALLSALVAGLGCLLPVAGHAVALIIAWLYYAGMECSSSHATLGKMALGLRVVDAKGSPVTFGRASVRFIGRILNTLLLGIGFLLIAFTERKQGLHDIIAGTLVLRRERVVRGS